MNTPGVSLFQGAESIKVNTSLERAEEEEALEDQRRRNEELGNLLQNAFDDLEDDETTIDSTTNFQSDLIENNNNKHHHQELPIRHSTNTAANQGFEAEIHQLKMLLESRTRETETIKQMANDEYKKRDELQKRLLIAEAELDRSHATRKNSHELLVESKERCSNLESTIEKLRNDKRQLELEHTAALGKLETAQTLLSDVQRKYDMVERDLNKHNERNAEQRRKQLEEHHRAEIELMQQQLEQLANKLDRKSHELENMSSRYQSLQSSHEMMLVDKASTINDLNHALNEAQKRCEELRGQEHYFQENVRLQKLVVSLQDQIHLMEKTISSLRQNLESTTAELDVMDNVLHQHNLQDTPSRRLSQTQGRVVGSTPLTTVDRMGNLKDELYRALANVKSKREEIRKLQQVLEERNSEIRTFKEEENKALVQITTLKESNIRLENRLKILEEELDETRHKTLNKSLNNSKTLQTLNDELKQLRLEKSDLEQQRNDLERMRNKHELERRKLDAQLKNVEVDLEELKQEHESMKRNYEQILKENQQLRSRTTADGVRLELEKHKFLLKDAQAECDRLKNLYVEISNAKDALAYEVDKLRNTDVERELQELREKVAQLQRALQLAEVKSSELTKILETEKLCHERDLIAVKEKHDKERAELNSKAAKDNANNCTKCSDYCAEMTKFEIQNLKLNNVNSVNKQEIDELTKQLNDSKTRLVELTEKLKLSEQQEELIKELKTKAHRFEEYIKTQSSASEKSLASPKQNTSSDKSVSTSPELQRAEIKRIESRIRDEMAKIFATELKGIQLKAQQTEERCQCLQREYQHISVELQQRQMEVDLLKQAILAEREKMEEILKEKDSEYQDVVKKQNVLMHKCRDELLAKAKQISELSKEMAERQTQIEAERQSMKAVMSQWETQHKNMAEVESDWHQRLQEQQQAHESAMETLRKNYESSKRTQEFLKRYADDMKTHMKKEYDRLKLVYDSNVAKIQMEFNEKLSQKNYVLKDSIGKKRELSNDKENYARN